MSTTVEHDASVGDPAALIERPRLRAVRTELERFMPRVRMAGLTECWQWTGSKNSVGYGQFSRSRSNRHIGAHRWAYEHAFGVIPDGMVVMHECDNRACVNPTHLRLGTQRDNMLDMIAKGRDGNKQRRKDKCKYGHPMSGDNLRRDRRGKRFCHECMKRHQRESKRRWYARKTGRAA
jgi:hypothetical protein